MPAAVPGEARPALRVDRAWLTRGGLQHVDDSRPPVLRQHLVGAAAQAQIGVVLHPLQGRDDLLPARARRTITQHVQHGAPYLGIVVRDHGDQAIPDLGGVVLQVTGTLLPHGPLAPTWVAVTCQLQHLIKSVMCRQRHQKKPSRYPTSPHICTLITGGTVPRGVVLLTVVW